MSIKGWLRRNSSLMAEAKDLARQLQEAWNVIRELENAYCAKVDESNGVKSQLRRVTRERYEERERRLAAEDKLAEMYESERPENILARYLEALENEEE